jgi:hypothetical protein
MTTSYSNLPPINSVDDVSEMPVAVRGKDIDPLLFDLLRTVSPHGKESKVNEILLTFISRVQPNITPHVDVKGNLIVQIGKNPKTMFSCHTDTVQSDIDQEFTTLHVSNELYVHASVPSEVTWYENIAGDTVTDIDMKQEARDAGNSFPFYTLLDGRLYGSKKQFDGWVDTHQRYATRTAIKPKACVLGADDKLGCYILCKLIEAGVSGLYVFHVGEEIGGIGSKYLSQHKPEYFTGIQHCVAFDRMDYSDIITHQSGGRCCSDTFANALAKQMSAHLPPLQKMAPSTRGSFTDSANYTSLIAECTNVSVGYFSQHTSKERFDLEWLERHLIPTLLKVDWAGLPVEREATPSVDRFPSDRSNSRYFGSGRNRSYQSQGSVVSAGSFTPSNDARRTQSRVDRIRNNLDEMESFDPREGFFNGESAGQKVQRVLYTFTKDDMTLSDIAQMVVDTHENAAYEKITWEDDAFWNM